MVMKIIKRCQKEYWVNPDIVICINPSSVRWWERLNIGTSSSSWGLLNLIW